MKLAYTISTSVTRFAAVAHAADVCATVRLLAGMGFDGVELAIRDPAHVEMDAIEETVRSLDIAVPAIGTGQAFVEEGLSLTAPEASRRDGAEARLLVQVGTAARFGALLIIGLIHGPVPPGETQDQAEERLLPALSRIAQAARRRGVRLVIEPINRYESNWLNTVDDVMKLLARLGEDNVGVLPDTFHMNIEEVDPAAALRAAASRLWHVHVADSNRRAPGFGHLDLDALVKGLSRVRYSGYVSAEILQHPTLEGAARQTVTTMRSLVPRGGA